MKKKYLRQLINRKISITIDSGFRSTCIYCVQCGYMLIYIILSAKGKMQYLLTLQVSRYCLLPLQNRMCLRTATFYHKCSDTIYLNQSYVIASPYKLLNIHVLSLYVCGWTLVLRLWRWPNAKPTEYTHYVSPSLRIVRILFRTHHHIHSRIKIYTGHIFKRSFAAPRILYAMTTYIIPWVYRHKRFVDVDIHAFVWENTQYGVWALYPPIWQSICQQSNEKPICLRFENTCRRWTRTAYA